MKTASPPRRRLFPVFIALLGLATLGAGTCWASGRTPPTGTSGPDADALAHRIEGAVGKSGWDEFGAVRWRLGGRNRHLWDRVHNRARVEFGDVTAYVDLGTHKGVALRDGAAVTGPDGDALVEKGWAWFCNDSFWLNPALKLFDDGVVRELSADGRLIVRYGAGGVTPGDTYEWTVDASGLPVTSRMWVTVMPIGGVKARWEGWVTLANGARYAATRRLGPLKIQVDDFAVAGTIAEIEAGEPFAVME